MEYVLAVILLCLPGPDDGEAYEEIPAELLPAVADVLLCADLASLREMVFAWGLADYRTRAERCYGLPSTRHAVTADWPFDLEQRAAVATAHRDRYRATADALGPETYLGARYHAAADYWGHAARGYTAAVDYLKYPDACHVAQRERLGVVRDTFGPAALKGKFPKIGDL